MPSTTVDYGALAARYGGASESQQIADAQRPTSPPRQTPRVDVPEPVPPPRDYGAIARELGGRVLEPTFRSENEKDATGHAVVRPTYPHANTVEALKGFGKEAITRALTFGEWARETPVVGDALKAISRELSRMTPEQEAAALAALREELRPSNPAQATGAVAEQIAEAIPAGMGVTKAAGWTASKIGPALSRYLGKTVGHLAPTAAVESAGAASIAAAQGGDPKTGAVLGAAFPVAGAAVRGVKNAGARAITNPNVAEREAVAFGVREGVPVDVATATGNRYVRGVQALADNSPLGGGIAGRAKVASDDALTRTGERLAGRTSAPAITQQQAGESVRKALSDRITQLHDDASKAYDTLRAAEADPKHLTVIRRAKQVDSGLVDAAGAPVSRTQAVEEKIPLAVDISGAKKALKPIYDQLMAAARITPPQGAKGRAVVALDRLMSAADQAPLSVVDEALSDLKALARGAEIPALRTQGQGIAAEAVRQLDGKVRARAAQAGPEVMKALMDGRSATKAKYAVAEIFEQLKDEPVRTIRALVAPKDTAIQQLREIGKVAPAELPKIGRAYLEDLLTTATGEGGFKHAQKIAADWQKLGAETKQLLYRKPGVVTDLDHFFSLARKMAESPNPSGTALTVNAGTQLGLLFTHPQTGVPIVLGSGLLSKMMHSPTVVKALTRAMAAPSGGPGRSALQHLIDASDEAGIVLATQAAQSAERAAATSPGARR